MDKRHSTLCVRPGQYRGYVKRGSVRVRLHSRTTRKVPALAQLAHPTLPHCRLGQSPMDPLPASPWSCRNSSSLWVVEENFQGPMGVPSFPQLAGASIGEGELEGWGSHTLTGGDWDAELTCECMGRVVCLWWQLAWLETQVTSSAELHARRVEREEHRGC